MTMRDPFLKSARGTGALLSAAACSMLSGPAQASCQDLANETVYVGVSAGSMVTAPIFGETYDDPQTPFIIAKGLGLVDFALLPHLDHKDHPESTMAKVERMAAEVPVPTYGIDDQTAIKVVDGTVDVISEGNWRLLTPSPEAS